MGLGPKGHPTFVEGRGPTPSYVGVPPCARRSSSDRLGSVRFRVRVHPLSGSIVRTDMLFSSFFFEQTCLFMETLLGIYIYSRFSQIFFNENLTSLHFIVIIICAIVL